MTAATRAKQYPVHGAGLGLRREIMEDLRDARLPQIGFMEVAPENWINVGGAWGRRLREFTERFDFVCHGLSLSIGSPAPQDEEFIKQVAAFMKQHGIKQYTEHLSYCSDDGHLYDLLPIPFTRQAADYVAERILRVQDIIGERIGMENASYYTASPGSEMQEIDFINTVLDKADCDLLIDINNIYVNSVNHGYDPVEFLRQLPAGRICYAHIAGHYNEADDLIVDTHGADVIETVWDLLDKAYELFGVFPTLLERDFNIPPLQQLLVEVGRIDDCQKRRSTARTKAQG